MMSDSNDTAFVSAYRKSKSTSETKRGFGLKLGCPLRDRWVAPNAKEVILKLEGVENELKVSLLRGFWNECPEFMHEDIHGWIAGQGLAIPWTKGDPYRFEMVRISGTEFSVRRPKDRATR